MITKSQLINAMRSLRKMITEAGASKDTTSGRSDRKIRIDTFDYIIESLKDAYQFRLSEANDIIADMEGSMKDVKPIQYKLPYPSVMIQYSDSEPIPGTNLIIDYVCLFVEIDKLSGMNKKFKTYADKYSFAVFPFSPTAVEFVPYVPVFGYGLVPHNPDENVTHTIELAPCGDSKTLLEMSTDIGEYLCQLLSCRNVEIRTKDNDKPKSRLIKNKVAEKTTDIIIKFPGKGILYRGEAIKEIPFHERKKYGITGQKRGHFKTFTEEKPLFGKHVGTWWWSPIFQTRKRDYVVEKE